MSDNTTTAQSSGNEAVIDQGVEQIAEASDAIGTEESAEELEASSEETQELEATGEGEETSEEEEALEEEIKELKKKLKLKVDGQEIEEEIDWNDEENLVKNLQKAKAFDKKAQEAAQVRKDMQGLVQALQQNPAAVLAQLGLDVDSMAAQHLESKIEELSKSPEQLAQEKMQQELEEKSKRLEELETKAEKAERERVLNEEANKIENEIIDAFKDYDGLLSTDDPTVIQDVAKAMLFAMQRGVKNVQVKDVIGQVEKQYVTKLQNRLGSLSKKDIALVEKLLGKDVFDQARKRRVSKKKKGKTETAKQIAQETGQNSQNTEVAQADEGPKSTYKDFFFKPS